MHFFDKTIEMRGNSPMLTSKVHVLLNISTLNFHDTSIRGIYDEMNENDGQEP